MPTRAIRLVHATSRDPAFVELTRQLDAELWDRYGELQRAYAVHNDFVTDTAAVAYVDGAPAACGCFKRFNDTTIELKRMFVAPELRGLGIGRAIVRDLETWAIELGFTAALLETGKRQPEAIELYEASGYLVIDNFGPYVGDATSVCMGKQLRRG